MRLWRCLRAGVSEIAHAASVVAPADWLVAFVGRAAVVGMHYFSSGDAARIRVIAPGHAFLDGTYDDISAGQTRELVLMGEAAGDVSMATGDQAPGIGAAQSWITDVVADVALVPGGSVSDGIYLLGAGQLSFLLIGRLRDRDAGRDVAVGDRIGASMIFQLNAGEYLDLLSPKTQMPIHVCRIDRIQLGDRGSPRSSQQTTLPAMRDVVWRDIEAVRFREASRFALAPFYLLDCHVVSQGWKAVERVLDELVSR